MAVQFKNIQAWLVDILDSMKKEIKNDFLVNNRTFARAHFGNRPISWLTPEELYPVFERELLKGDEELADWVINQWVFKNGDVYDHFADKLSEINPNFDEIESLTVEQSKHILEGAKTSFGSKNAFLFASLNGVVFPKSIFEELEKEAKVEKAAQIAKEKTDAEDRDIAKIIERHQKEVAKLTEKFEQKVAGIQKKYDRDVAALRKQLQS